MKIFKKKYNGNVNLRFTDTDSLLHEIYTDEIYKDMLADITDYDFSSYPKDHPNYSPNNKKAIGKFKDEWVNVRIIYRATTKMLFTAV